MIGGPAMIAARMTEEAVPTGEVPIAAPIGEAGIDAGANAEPEVAQAFTRVACATSIAPPRNAPSQYIR